MLYVHVQDYRLYEYHQCAKLYIQKMFIGLLIYNNELLVIFRKDFVIFVGIFDELKKIIHIQLIERS